MPGLTSQEEAQDKINESGPIEPMTHTMVDPSQITRGPAKKKKIVVKKPLHATNKNKKLTGSKTEDEPTQDNGETAKMNPKVSANEAFKPHMMYDPKTGKGYMAKKYEDHIRMQKMGYTHDEPKNEGTQPNLLRKRSKKPRSFKKTFPHLSGINAPKPQTPQFNSKDWDLDKLASLDETQFKEFIDSLTEEEYLQLEGVIGSVLKAPFKAAGWAAKKITHNNRGNFRLSTAGRADSAEDKYKKAAQKEKDKYRLAKYKTKLDALNKKSLKGAIKGAQPAQTTGPQNNGTEYQGGTIMKEMSKIRRALLDVVEKKQSHGHTDAREKWSDKFKGAGAQKMKKDLEDNPKDNPIWNKEKESHDDAEKAGRAGPGKSPARSGADNLKGDLKIVPPGTKMKDPGAPKTKLDPNVDKGKPSTNENKVIDNIMDAYGKMKKKATEELKGDQHKIDHNKDGKITKHDFEGLRKKKEKTEDVAAVKQNKPLQNKLDKLYGPKKDKNEDATMGYGAKPVVKKPVAKTSSGY